MDRQEEFIGLLMRHQADLRAFVGSIVRDSHGCDDLIQDVALTAWREFDRYERSRSFGAWARGIAAKKLMQRGDRLSRSPVPLSPEAIQAVLEAYDRRERAAPPQAEALDRCVEQLPQKSRQLLALRYEESRGLGEIAQQVNGTLEGVHKALVRIRQQLRECVQRQLASLKGGTP